MLNSQNKMISYTNIEFCVGMLTQPETYLKTGRILQARQDVPGSFLLCPKHKKVSTGTITGSTVIFR
jgi:hypothetical protein